jgi:hypothetical protein
MSMKVSVGVSLFPINLMGKSTIDARREHIEKEESCRFEFPW